MHDKKSVPYGKYVKEATKKLQNYEYKEAYDLIMKAIYENPNDPAAHNLLGIWYEFDGNKDLARKHYRIAYVLNPVYKPATINLERVSTLYLEKNIAVAYEDKQYEALVNQVNHENNDNEMDETE